MDVVTTHKNTDFDGFASTMAATIVYPGSIPVLPKPLNPNVKAFLSIHKDVFKTSSADNISLGDVERLIVVDTNRWARLGKIRKLKENDNLEVFLWDHHTNDGDIVPVWKCQEPMGANITLLIRRIKEERKLLTPIQATLFLAGLYEDTGNLTFPATTAEDAYAAAYLLEHKADLNIIRSFLRPAYGEKQKAVLFEMLRTAKRDKVNGFSVSINRLTVNAYVDSLAIVVRMYREILNVNAAIGIFVDAGRNRCMIIGRSDADSIDIGAMMRSIGGGGHPAAGSAVIKSADPDAVEGMMRELIQGNRQSSVQVSDLMSFPVFTVSPETSMKEVAAMLRDKGCTGFPVVDNGRLKGMISRRDFKRIKKESQLKAPVRAFMTTDVMTIAPGKSPSDAARLMVKHDIGRLPVVEDEVILGILTRSDTMLYFYDLLPD